MTAEVGEPVTEPLDRDLVGAVRAGGDGRQHAWSLLVTRHSGRLYAVARSFGLDPATSEDLVQVAWLRLLERSDQIRDADAVAAWLCMIVRNEARRLLTRRREVPTDDVLAPDGLDRAAAPAEAADASLLRGEQAASVRAAFARLSADCRQLLRLVLADPPLSYDEIAVAVGRPRGSLGPTRRRCLEQLRTLLPAGEL